MEKLTELLREYNMSNQSPYILGDANYYVDSGLYAPQIISKSYGFIKWLVDNNKIDNRKIFEGWNKMSRDIEFTKMKEFYEGIEEFTLMLLSISNSPIEDLILYLK